MEAESRPPKVESEWVICGENEIESWWREHLLLHLAYTYRSCGVSEKHIPHEFLIIWYLKFCKTNDEKSLY